MDTLKML